MQGGALQADAGELVLLTVAATASVAAAEAGSGSGRDRGSGAGDVKAARNIPCKEKEEEVGEDRGIGGQGRAGGGQGHRDGETSDEPVKEGKLCERCTKTWVAMH